MSSLRHALRTLARTPALTLVAIASLALGFGANAAILSVFRQVLLRPLPVPQAERLVNLSTGPDRSGSVSCGNAGECDAVFSAPMVRDLERAVAERPTGVTGLAAHRAFSVTLAGVGRGAEEARAARGSLVSGGYFPVLGLTPALGRLLGPDDDRPNGPAVAVLAHAYWRAALGGDPAIVGRTLLVNGRALTVVGVAPAGFGGTVLDDQAAVFVPLALAPAIGAHDARGMENRRDYWVYLFARLAPGATADRVRQQLGAAYGAILRDVEVAIQEDRGAAARARFLALPLRVAPGARGQTRVHSDGVTPLAVLLVTSGLVVLVACANVANLLLARGAARRGEMALRESLGATRGRLVRLVLAESLVLAAAGGAAGVLVARPALAALVRRLPEEVAGGVDPHVDPWLLATTVALALGTGLVFGLYPALHATRGSLVGAMRGGAGQIAGASRTARRFRAGLAAGQVALALALLGTAGLLARTLVNLGRERLGVTAERVVTFVVAPERGGMSGTRAHALFDRLEATLRAQPGVTGVAAARLGLLRDSESGFNVSVEGYRHVPGADEDAQTDWVTPGFFRTLGASLRAGREFGPGDRAGAPGVVVVNEAFVRRFNLGAGAVGKRIALGAGDGIPLDREIVGVVADVKYSRVRGPVPPVFYQPARGDTTVGRFVFYARTAGDPAALERAVPGLVRALDAGVPVEELRTLPAQARASTAIDRLVATLAGGFALLATLLAAVGLYGVLAYAVAQRTREIGVRMALGATGAAVRRLVLADVGRLFVVGSVVGLLGALAFGRAARSLLYGVGPADPVALLGAAALLAAVAWAAGAVPAARAARVAPTRALRGE